MVSHPLTIDMSLSYTFFASFQNTNSTLAFCLPLASTGILPVKESRHASFNFGVNVPLYLLAASLVGIVTRFKNKAYLKLKKKFFSLLQGMPILSLIRFECAPLCLYTLLSALLVGFLIIFQYKTAFHWSQNVDIESRYKIKRQIIAQIYETILSL